METGEIMDYIECVCIIILVYITIRIILYHKNLKKQRGVATQFAKNLTQRLEHLEEQCAEVTEKMASQVSKENSKPLHAIINLGNLRIAAESISYITTQAAESPDRGSPRIKVIHYTDGRFPDSVYCSFAEILEQAGEDFMLVNKKQIVNLRQVRRVQGSEFYLENVNTPFTISKQNLEDFNQRFDAINLEI